MISWVNIVGAQNNGTHAQHDQRLQEVDIVVQWNQLRTSCFIC